MEPIIKVDNVSMCFNLSTEKHESLKEYLLAMVQGRLQYDEFYALRDVSLDIMPGDFYGLVGLNGSGKSTLLKTIAGVYKPSKGKVTVNGTIAPLIELGAGFDMDLTARENIYLNGTVLGFSPKYLDEKFDEIVEFSELQNFLDVPLKNYSSGMVARIGFAIATITKPDILIADEVLSVGDFLFQQKCEKRMKELMAGGTTVHSGVPLHRADRAHVQQGGMAEPRPSQDERRHPDRLQRLQGRAAGRGIRRWMYDSNAPKSWRAMPSGSQRTRACPRW
jgi:galliderm_ABC: lantibiotic protection ABC transporter, ATP-binding subunit